MFKFLKDKLKSWTEKVSQKAEAEEVEEIEEVIEKPKERKKAEKEKTEKPKKEKAPKEKPHGPISEEQSEEKIEEELREVREDKEKEGLKEESSEVEEESKPGTESFFKRFTSKIGKVKISEETFNIYSEELEMLLLENNVAFEVTEEIIKKLKENIVGRDLLKKEIEYEIKDSLKSIIEEILVKPFDIIQKIKDKNKSGEPYVILFCGINGSGKTTTVAKIARYLKSQKLSCVLAAGDTFRAASIEQLKKHGDKLGVKVIAQNYGADPAAVGFDAINYAKKNHTNCVLIDTAGRMHTAKNLLKEMEKIVKVCKPDTKVFIGESITGNDAIEQVRSFDWAIGIDGIVLTKADIDEKGGTSLSVGYVTKKPILYLGTGQEYEEIEPFDKKKFIERLGL